MRVCVSPGVEQQAREGYGAVAVQKDIFERVLTDRVSVMVSVMVRVVEMVRMMVRMVVRMMEMVRMGSSLCLYRGHLFRAHSMPILS